MPLLVVAILTHIIYKAISNGLDWTGEASRKAWGKSLDHSRSLVDRIRQRMTDTLDAWDQDPRGRRYAATGVRMALGTGRLLGKIGVGTVLGTLKAAGAVSRALAGGALATGGLIGSLAGSIRWGARAGSEWWRSRHRSRRWKWFDWFPGWAEEKADRWWNWGDTFPGETGPDPYDEDSAPPVDPEEPKPGPQPGDPYDQYEDDGSDWERPDPREPEASAEPEGEKEPKVVVVGWGDPINEKTGDSTTPLPTPVGSTSAGTPAVQGTATAVLDRPTGHAIEGETMPTDLVPANGGTVAPIANAADGMQYEQAQAFLAEQERRARELADLAEQIHSLQIRLMNAAAVMGGDHSAAESALARFGVKAPNVADAIALLHSVASPAPAEAMVTTHMALDAVASSCNSDASNLQTRFGTAWEITKSEQIDGQFYNG